MEQKTLKQPLLTKKVKLADRITEKIIILEKETGRIHTTKEVVNT